MSATVIGICGRSGSGKSYVSSCFASFGGRHIDTDAIYHDLLKPRGGEISACTKAIADEFGQEVVKDGTLDRTALRKIVFSDREKLSRLNEISHAFIKKETLSIIKHSRAPFLLIDAPLLFESGFDALCDVTVCVTADEATQIRRIMKRDGIGEDDARRRLATQISNEELEAKCDYTVFNGAGVDAMPQVEKILIDKGLIK